MDSSTIIGIISTIAGIIFLLLKRSDRKRKELEKKYEEANYKLEKAHDDGNASDVVDAWTGMHK